MNQLLRLFQRRQMITSAVIALLVVASTAGIGMLGVFEPVELSVLDALSLSAADPLEADTNIVLIAIDQNSLEALAARNVHWPWPRELYGAVVQYLTSAKASVIAFDIEFSRKDFDRRETEGALSDATFADAMRENGRVVLTTVLSTREPGDQPGTTVRTDLLKPMQKLGIIHTGSYDRASGPLTEFQSSCRILGVGNVQFDSDGIVRRASLGYRFKEGALPSLALGCILAQDRWEETFADRVRIFLDNPSFLMRFYGPGGPDGAFQYYPFSGVLSSAIATSIGDQPLLSPQLFEGKIVIVGGTAPGLLDFKPTPFTSAAPYPGMEIHATALSNLLNSHRIIEAPRWAGLLILSCLAVLSAFSMARFTKVLQSLVAEASLLLAFTVGVFILFSRLHVSVPFVMPATGAILSFGSVALVSYASEGRQRKEMRRAFNRYLNPVIVHRILEQPESLDMGGQAVSGTVFFSDIKNFTTIAETMPVKALVKSLNEYFADVSDVILRKNAFLDKFIGDAVMAVFGVPLPEQSHALSACLTSLEIQRKLRERHTTGGANIFRPNFETRIGLHSGTMIVGNIGSARHMDYTAIGDTVNLASRLEGVNKVFGTSVIISETTFNEATGGIEARELDVIRVKGRQRPLKIFELIGAKGDLDPTTMEFVGLFHEGLQWYRHRDWDRAIQQFESLVQFRPDDGPSSTYLERCRLMKFQVLPEEWDGVFSITTK